MELKYIGVVALALSPALTIAEGVDGNNLTIGFGTVIGDREIFGEDPSSSLFFGGSLNVFLTDAVYAIGSIGNQRIQWEFDSTSEVLSSSITNFGAGLGYESPVSDTSSLYIQGGFSIGSGAIDYEAPGQSESYDVNSNSLIIGFGLRGLSEHASWAFGAGYQSTNIKYDDQLGFEDEESTDVTFNGQIFFVVSNDLLIGPAVTTDFDTSLITANLRYKF